MLIKIAWRNIWRSRGRSLVVLGAIVVGIWALVTATGFMNGFIVGYMAEVINHDISNIQIHHPEFKKDYEAQYFIHEGKKKAEELRDWQEVQAVTTRIILNGMIASARKASGVQIRGIDLENEALVTRLDSLIVDGAYFIRIKRNPIVIGEKLAEKLSAKIQSKVVLTFTDKEQNITAAAFRVAGIMRSSSINLNEMSAFVLQKDLSRILDSEEIHEIAILTKPLVDERLVVANYQQNYPQDLTETWREVSPELELMNEMYASMISVLVVIVMLALVFGIVNTMLMAVLERIRELGMLMAIGMTRVKVFSMVLLETLFLGILGSPIGLLLGWLMMNYYTTNGLDLSSYSEGLEAFGYSSMLYPYVEINAYITITIAVIITAFIAAIYPAWKAIRLKPVEALHSI